METRCARGSRAWLRLPVFATTFTERRTRILCAMTRACPACRADAPRIAGSIDAATVVNGNATYRADALSILGLPPDRRFDIARCTRCGFVYARELPDEAFLARLYGQAIDPARAAESARSTSWLAHQLEITAALLARLSVPRAPRVLDYGCGDGSVVRALAAMGIAATGFDPYLREMPAAPPARFSRSLEELDPPFDAVLLSDVLEHVPDPAAVLARCHALLAPRGWLCVSVPDFSTSRLEATLGDLARGRPVTKELNPWEHLNYFSPESLARMVTEAGLAVDVQPPPAFGFRKSARGVRRLGNAMRSAARLARFALRPSAGTTTMYAQKG